MLLKRVVCIVFCYLRVTLVMLMGTFDIYKLCARRTCMCKNVCIMQFDLQERKLDCKLHPYDTQVVMFNLFGPNTINIIKIGRELNCMLG